jgi:TM2 domain-containing membrane protein YozV
VYSLDTAYLMWALAFIFPGLHRFYLGKIGSGILHFCTRGLFFIGWILDFRRLPEMVREANLQIEYKKVLHQGMVNTPPSRKVYVKETVEKVILKTAKKNKGLATPSQVALEGDISIEDAKNYLEKLVSKGFAELKVRKSGTLVYYFHDLSEPSSSADFEDF